MKEVTVRPDLFILPMGRDEFFDKIDKLTGEDKQQILAQANEFKNLSDAVCNMVFLINKRALMLLIQEENPTFNPDTDFIFVSNGERNTLPIKRSSRSTLV